MHCCTQLFHYLLRGGYNPNRVCWVLNTPGEFIHLNPLKMALVTPTSHHVCTALIRTYDERPNPLIHFQTVRIRYQRSILQVFHFIPWYTMYQSIKVYHFAMYLLVTDPIFAIFNRIPAKFAYLAVKLTSFNLGLRVDPIKLMPPS